MRSPKILVVDDEEPHRDILAERLQMHGYEVLTACDGAEALEKVEEMSPDLVLLDILLPDINGMEVLSRVKREHPETLVIMITAHGTVQRAVEAMRQGAYDFIEKPFDPDIVKMTVDKALERQWLVRQNEYLRSELKGEYGEIIGESQKMMDVLRAIEKAAPLDSNVLITGESGTGKELVARAIHYNSARRDGAFIRLNCACFPSDLIEDELFGHSKGAFSGATSDREGAFEAADGGTIFLDEIGDMPLEMQPRLMRVLEEREVKRIGENIVRNVDVRVLAAMNQDLEAAVSKGKFRGDLLERLYVIPIHLPHLRERKEDIAPLVEHFIEIFNEKTSKRIKGISEPALNALTQHDWPRNVRELRNVIERTVIFMDGDVIEERDLIHPEHLLQKVRASESSESNQAGILIKLGTDLKEVEKTLILKTLEEVGDNRQKAADLLGMSLRTLQYRLKEYRDESQT